MSLSLASYGLCNTFCLGYMHGIITVRIPKKCDRQLNKIRADCQRQGIPFSRWVRSCLFDRPESAGPSAAFAPVTSVALELLCEVNRITYLVNQLREVIPPDQVQQLHTHLASIRLQLAALANGDRQD